MKTATGPLYGRKRAAFTSGRSEPRLLDSSSSSLSHSSTSHRLRPLLFLLFISFVSRANGQDSFYFKVKPKNHDVEEGKPVRLRCQVSNNKDIEYHWTLNSELVTLDSRRKQDGSDLNILKADAELDSGKFRCVATNRTTHYSLQSSPATINVFWMSPNVTVQLVEPKRLPEVELGGALELRCASSAHPPVKASQISWYKNYQKLKRKTSQQIGIQLQANGNMRINMIEIGNVGIYRCFVHHPAGKVTSRPFPLIFAGNNKYNTSTKPEDYLIYVKRLSPMSINCPAFNYSIVHFVKWVHVPALDVTDPKYYNVPMDASCNDQYNRRMHSSMLCTLPEKQLFGLYRRRVRKRSDVGFFQCEILPWHRKPSTIEVRLATNPKLPINSLYPMPSRKVPAVVVVKGKDLTIRLYQDLTRDSRNSIVPDPPPLYNWYPPNSETPVPAYSSFNTKRVYKLKDRNLHIKDAKKSDSGKYVLEVSNLARTYNISVPVVVAFEPRFKKVEMYDQDLTEEGNAKFFCPVVEMAAYPIARILWYKNGKRIPESSRLKENQRTGEFNIDPVTISDEGVYKCGVSTVMMKPKVAFKSNEFKVVVRRKLKILNPIKKDFMQRNQEYSIACQAQGYGNLYVQWYHKNRVLQRTPIVAGGPYVRQTKLIIPKVTDKHAGNYTCSVSDSVIKVNNTVKLIVGERPIIVHISNNMTVVEGKSVMLNCKATGDPRPTISWIKRRGRVNSKVESFTKDKYSVVTSRARRVMMANGSLLIRRAKLDDGAMYGCVAGNTYAMNSEKEVSLRVISKGASESSGRDTNWSMTKTVIIVVGCAVAYLALIIGLTIYCSVRMLRNRQKRAAWAVAKMEGGVPGGPGHENGRLMAMPNGESQGLMSAPDGAPGPGHADSRSHFSSASAYTRSLRAGTPNSSLQERMSTYPRHQLQTLGMLGKGEFGDVFLARAHNIREGEPESLVVIKSHHNGHNDSLDYEFHQQMDMFAKLDHDFVVKLVGVCREVEPEFMILEYCEWGDLKQFLKAMRQSDKESNERNVKIPPLTASQKVTMCSQVALGMEHLSNYRYVHKDLAARNVLLTSTLDLKIANLGLCQDVYAGEYFPMRNKRLPLRWLPSEVILEDAYSTKSDVWAFGVLVYEVFTLGDIPHRRLTDLQVINAAESHYLMPELPAQCPAELASLLRQCWSDKPRERPSFNDISVIIGELTVDSDI